LLQNPFLFSLSSYFDVYFTVQYQVYFHTIIKCVYINALWAQAMFNSNLEPTACQKEITTFQHM